jgi:hypothetical protein
MRQGIYCNLHGDKEPAFGSVWRGRIFISILPQSKQSQPYMIDSSQVTFQALSIHYTGNKAADEPLTLSGSPIDLSDTQVRDGLLRYFFSHFRKPEYYRFTHSDSVSLNTVYSLCERIFSDGDRHELSVSLARYLYERSVHPQIKGGEFYVAYFKNCLVDDEVADAIGIFKTEAKNQFFKVEQQGSVFRVFQDCGVSEEKLDKGCLVFKTEKQEGYKVCIADTAARGAEARYWRDDFLGLAPANDDYHKTNNFLSLCKSYIKEQMPEEFAVEKTAQIDMLNKSVDFFKKHDRFDFKEFSAEVIQEPVLVQSFERYKDSRGAQYENGIEDRFDISDTAVRKQSKVFKSILKLDKNFHIYIHGNKDLIEKGYDEAAKMNYYKIYFREES